MKPKPKGKTKAKGTIEESFGFSTKLSLTLERKKLTRAITYYVTKGVQPV